jgi:hypothetical protein
VLQNNDKDDTFDKLFANIKKDKIRVLSVPLDSSSELNPKEEEESNDANCWGLFKSFSEKVCYAQYVVVMVIIKS